MGVGSGCVEGVELDKEVGVGVVFKVCGVDLKKLRFDL